MENNIGESILSVCRLLNKYSVQYIIVGGAAVALHGYFRHSMNSTGGVADKPDLDIWYNPTYENYFKLLNALEELGQDVTEFKEEQTPNPKKSFFKYQFENFTLDLLPELKASLTFRLSLDSKEVISIDGVEIPFINYKDLIIDKQTNARPKDISDVEQLEFKRKLKESN